MCIKSEDMGFMFVVSTRMCGERGCMFVLVSCSCTMVRKRSHLCSLIMKIFSQQG